MNETLINWIKNKDFFLPENEVQLEKLGKKLKADHTYETFQDLLNNNNAQNLEIMRMAICIAQQSDVSTNNLVLYSSHPENYQQAYDLINSDHKYDILETTPAGHMLDRLDLFTVLNDDEMAYLPWFSLSMRLTMETTTQHIKKFTKNAADTNTYRMVELLSLANDNVETIDGKDKTKFTTEISPFFLQYLQDSINSFNEDEVTHTQTNLTDKFSKFINAPYSPEYKTNRDAIKKIFMMGLLPILETIKNHQLIPNKEKEIINDICETAAEKIGIPPPPHKQPIQQVT